MKKILLLLSVFLGQAFAASPMIWQGTYSRNLAPSGVLLYDGKTILHISVDPSAGAGVAAAIGSIALANIAGVGSTWVKDGAANTDWSALSTATITVSDTSKIDLTLTGFDITATIVANSLLDADINASAAIARTKLASGTVDHVVINDGSGVLSSEAQLAITRGGTGQATANAAFNALAPSQTSNSTKVLTTDGTNTSWGGGGGICATNANNSFYCGTGAGTSLTTGADNTFVGSMDGNAMTTGGQNTFYGRNSGLLGVSTVGSTGIGFEALRAATSATGRYTAVGYQALRAVTTGVDNSAFGYGAGAALTTGTQNLAMGTIALNLSTTGNNNVAIGHSALRATAAGSQNVGIGVLAMNANTTGQNNVGIGYLSLTANTSAQSNVALGRGSGQFITTGSVNTVLGFTTAAALTTGTRNVIVGANSNTGAATTDATTLGHAATATANFSMALGSGASSAVANQISIGTVTETTVIPGTLSAATGNIESNKFKVPAVSTTDAVDLATAEVAGILPVANGGTNNSSAYTSSGVLFFDGTKVTENAARFQYNSTDGIYLRDTGSQTFLTTYQDAAAATVASVDVSGNFTSTGNVTLTSGGFFRTNGVLHLYNAGDTFRNTLKSQASLGSNLTIELPNTAGSSGDVLTTDGAGVTSWTTPSAGTSWNLAGNTGTTPGTDFIGTTDVQDLVFKTNSTEALRISSGGNLTVAGFSTADAVVKADSGGLLTASLLTNNNVASFASIARSKLASGTADHVLINSGGGVMSSEAQLAVSRGGTGLASGTSGGILGYTASGTLASSAALGASEIVLGGGAGATPTSLGSLGTTTTVLHGNAAGAPTFGAVSLTADVSGVLPLANGGTNKNMTAAAGGVVYTDADSQEVTAAGTAGQVLTSNGTSAPTWSFPVVSNGGDTNYTIPSTTYEARSGTTLTADRTWTLPVCSSNIGERHLIKKADSGAFTITVDGDGTDTLDGAANFVLVSQYDSVTVICAVSGNWDIE